MPNGTYTDVDELPDLKSGSASAKQAVQYQSVDDLTDLKKKDGGQQSSTGSVNSNQASSSPSPAPSNSNQQEQPIPKYLVNIDGTTTPLHSDNEYSIPSIQQSIDQHNRQINAGGSVATGIPQKNVVPSSSDIEDKKQRAASVQIDADKAIDNTVKKMGAQQGVGGKTGINEEFEKQKLANQLANGEVGVGYDKDGNLGLKQKPTGFLDAFNKSYNNSREEALNADLFTNGSTTEERVAALKLKHDEENKDPFIGTKEDFGTAVGRVTGGAIEGLQKFGAGAMLGSAAVAAAPESAGTSLTGLPTALGVAMGSKDAFNIGYASEVERAYNSIKRSNPNISDIDAMKQAEKQGNVGGTIGLATNAALMGGGIESGSGIVKDAISDGAKNIIGDALKGTAKMASLPAAGQAATEEVGNLQGIKTSQSDVVKDAVQTFKNNLTPAVLLHLIGAGAAGLTQLPKPVENSLKFAATELDPTQIKATLEGGEKTGFYPAGTAELITHDINNFKEATDKIPSDVPDDKKAEIAPLIQNKQALVEEQKTKDSSFKESYQNKIDAVDSQIKQIIERPKVEEPAEEVNNNSSPINTTENEQSSSKEANASSEGRQEVSQNEEAVQPEKETASSIDNEKPVSDKIQPDDTFRTLDYGEHKGEEESEEKQNQIKQDIINDKPLGKTGEKFTDFVSRVVPAFKDLIDKEPNNTTVVTHSSVIKALDVWEDMGRPDIENMTDKQKQKFAEKYVKEDITKEGGVSTFKGEGDKVIHAIRHGETEDNKMSEFREDNTKLTDKGEKQAAKAGQELKQITGGEVPKIISSDLPRAIHTSNIISEQLKPSENVGENAESNKGNISDTEGSNISIPNNKEGEKGVEKTLEEGESTGIKKSITEEERAKRMLPEVKLPKLGSDDEVLQRGKENVDTGKIKPRDVVDRVIKDKGIYTPEEAGAMQYYAHQLSKEESNIKDEIEDHPVGSPERAGAVNKLGQLSDEIDRMTEANRTNSNSWGKLGNVMQMETDESFNPSLIKTIIKENYAGEVPKDIQKKLDEALKMRDDAIRELKEAKEKMATKSIAKDAEAQERAAKRKQTKEELKAEREQILKDIKKGIKKDLGNINTGIPIPTETLTAIGKLAVNYFKEGVVTIDGLTDQIYNDLKGNGLTKRSIREAISNYSQLRESAKQKEVDKLGRKEADLNKQLETGRLKETPKKSDIVFRKSSEMIEAEQRIYKAEARIQSIKKNSFDSQKNYYQKALDWAGRLVRLSVLSGTNVLYKLASAATIGGAVKRIPEQAFGKMYSMAFKGIAEKAPIEGSFNANAEANFYKEFFNPVKFAKNTAEILKTGESYLGHKFSKGEDHHIPVMYVMTDLHQVIKDPLKRAAYESSFRNGIIHAEKNGYDIKDPLVVNSIENAAYKRAKYEIFQESNALTNAFTSWKNKLEKGEGKIFWQKAESKNVGSTAKFLTDFLIPVSTVPTNIVKRVMSTSPLGLIRGGLKVEEAYRKGLNNLSSDEAESVMRQLKQGTLGTALWLAGWYGYKSFGGLYTPLNPDKKRGHADLSHDQMDVNGQLIPKPVQHAIPLEVVQLAATARRLYEDKKEKGDVSFNTLEKTGLGTIGALVGDVPIISTPVEAIEASKSDYEANKFKEDMESRFTPQILRENTPKKKTHYGGGGSSGGY